MLKERMRERMAKAASQMSKATAKAGEKMKQGAAIAREGAMVAAVAAKNRGAELARRLENAEPGKATVRRLLEGALSDWVEGGIGAEWRDEEDRVVPAEEEEDGGGGGGGGGAAADEADDGGSPRSGPRGPGGASLRVSLRKGELVLRDVRLKRRALEPMGCPYLTAESGTVGEVRIVFPWAHLGSRPVKVEVRQVTVHVRLTRDDEELSASSGASETDLETRRHELDLLEALREHWRALSEEGALGGAPGQGFGRRVAARALEKVEIRLRDVRATYAGADGTTFGAAFESLDCRDDGTSGDAASKRRVTCELRGLGATSRVDGGEERALLSPASLDGALEANGPVPNTRPPIDAVRATWDALGAGSPHKEKGARGEVARAGWALRVSTLSTAGDDGLSIDVGARDADALLKSCDALAVASRRVALRPLIPERPVSRYNAKRWWTFAFAFASREAELHRPRDRWQNAIKLLLVQRDYVPLRARAVAPKKLRATWPKLAPSELEAFKNGAPRF